MKKLTLKFLLLSFTLGSLALPQMAHAGFWAEGQVIGAPVLTLTGLENLLDDWCDPEGAAWNNNLYNCRQAKESCEEDMRTMITGVGWGSLPACPWDGDDRRYNCTDDGWDNAVAYYGSVMGGVNGTIDQCNGARTTYDNNLASQDAISNGGFNVTTNNTASGTGSGTASGSSNSAPTLRTGLSASRIAIMCGDGIEQDHEFCDDGNDIDDDSCSNDCGPVFSYDPGSYCGDNTVDNDEECDDGNSIDNDTCSNQCEEVEEDHPVDHPDSDPQDDPRFGHDSNRDYPTGGDKIVNQDPGASIDSEMAAIQFNGGGCSLQVAQAGNLSNLLFLLIGLLPLAINSLRKK